MAGKKSVSKSIRLTPDLCGYIEGYRGNGFNEKFENIINDARLSEPGRLARLEILDKRIREREELLREVSNKAADLVRDIRILSGPLY